MKLKDLFGLKYYIMATVLSIGFYAWSGLVGWQWINTTSTEKNRPTQDRNNHYRFYHK